MAKFAKLFELENDEQVLLTMSYNDDNNTHDVSMRTDVDGVMIQMTPGFKSEEKAQNIINSFTLEQAIEFRRSAEDLAS